MDKLLTFQTQTEKGIFLYTVGEGRDQIYLEKTASADFHPEIAEYIKNAQKIPGKTQTLLTALGAGEYYGSNVNGDFFPEIPLKNPTPEFGYKTFERMAKVYKHHVNKDPKKSYGEVALSVWNDKMKRVELIVIIDDAKAPDIVERINNGEYPEVSMGCFRATAPVLLSNFSELPISDCSAGTEIISGTGNVQTIEYNHHHFHNGTWYYFDLFGNNEAIEPTTEEHPWKILKRSAVECIGNKNNKSRKQMKCTPNSQYKKGCRGCDNISLVNYTHSWVKAEDVSVGDFVGTPILQGNEASTEDKLFISLMGLYLAEGYISKDGYIHLTVNNTEVPRIESKFKDYVHFKIKGHSSSTEATVMSIYDKTIARRLKEYLGTGAHTKRISAEVMRWDEESQLTLLGEYLNGDGGVYKGSAYFSTCNKTLAYQIQAMLLRCDIISSLNTNLHKPSTVVLKDTVEYQVWCGTDTSYLLSDYTAKKGLRASKNINDKRFIANGYLWSPVVNIECEPCSEEVYNIAIGSGDHNEDSYIVNSSAVHNCRVPYDVCSICGNKAKTRAQYCDHLRYHMNKIPPGHTKKAYAMNTIPKFFDISFVLVGADRIASVMKKVAHMHPQYGVSSAQAAEASATSPVNNYMEKRAFGLDGLKVASKKIAEMKKVIPSNLEGNTAGILDQLGLEGAEALRPLEQEMPKTVIIKITRGTPGMAKVNKILSTLAMMGILPKKREFQDIVLRGMGHVSVADRMESRGETFDSNMFVPRGQRQACLNSLDLSPSNFDMGIFNETKPFLEDRSYARPLLKKRVIRLVKLAESGQLEYPIEETEKYASESDERTPIGITTLMAGLAGMYYALSDKAARASEKGIGKALVDYPALALALGVGTVVGAKHLFADTSRGKYDFDPETGPIGDLNMSWQDQIKMKNKNPLTKMGSIKGVGKSLFLGVPALYLASGVQEVRNARNPGQEGIIGKTIRKYPDVLSAGLVGHAMMGSPVTKKLKGALGFMRKAAEDNSKSTLGKDMLSTAVFSLAFPGKSLVSRAVGNTVDQGIISGIGKLLSHKRSTEQGGTRVKY